MSSIKLSLRKIAEPSRALTRELGRLDKEIQAEDTLAANPFSLYDNKEGWEDASDALMTACKNASIEIANVVRQYKRFGATDTASREAILEYLREAVLQVL